ncbi:MAG: nitrile hydratase subunit beta [Rhodospirillales bacterium]|nr:nitrile hydratase subunit beta [Rhodospirillales bacterium]
MTARFAVGDSVRVREAYPPGHIRTPYFIRGKAGKVTAVLGDFANPEELAYRRPGTPALPVYWIEFPQTELWSDYAGPKLDTAVVDVFENWLEPVEGSGT